MGSPLSPVIANIFMESFENDALSSFRSQPKLWIRYVDDTFVLWPHGDTELNSFHDHLNSQHPSIQFTKEEEIDEKIPFLDVLVERKLKGISTRVYRNPTHTDRYIHYKSNHHPCVKSGIIKCLRNRLDRVCDKSSKRDELNHLRSVFQANGYPPQVVSRALRPRAQCQQDLDTADKPKILYVPYIQHITEPIQRVCRKLGVKIVFRTPHTLRQQLVKLKTARPKLKKNVIYKVPCLDCTSVYIGETGRCLQVRLTEHKAAVKRGDRKNAIATHAWDHNHRVNWEGAQVIQTEPFYWKRRVLEAIIIRNHDTTSNLDCGLSLDPLWTPLLDIRN